MSDVSWSALINVGNPTVAIKFFSCFRTSLLDLSFRGYANICVLYSSISISIHVYDSVVRGRLGMISIDTMSNGLEALTLLESDSVRFLNDHLHRVHVKQCLMYI